MLKPLPSASVPSIEIRNLTLGYDGHPAVHHLNGTIEPGSLLAVMGPNGSGKSTLLKGLMGQLRPLGGEIVIDSAARRAVAYLPQQAGIDRTFPITVGQLVTLGAWGRLGLLGGLTPSVRRDVGRAIAAVGLEGFENRPIDRLSGGQLQRALFARVMVQEAPVILLDEPFNAIDTRTSEHLVAIVNGWHREGRTISAVLHDLALVREVFPQTLLLARTPVAWGPTSAVLMPANLTAARQMAEQWDETAPHCHVDHLDPGPFAPSHLDHDAIAPTQRATH